MLIRRWILCLGVVSGAWLTGCATASADSRPSYAQAGYELLYNEPSRWERSAYFGRVREGWSPCRALFWKDGLLFVLIGGQVTLYKPGDGIFVSLNGFLSDDKGGRDADPNRCLHHLFWQAGNTGAQYYAILHPELKALFDNARSDPAALMREISTGAPGFTRDGRWREAKVSVASEVRVEGNTGYGNYRSQLLPNLSVTSLFPDIAQMRVEASQQLAAKQRSDAKVSQMKRDDATRAAGIVAAARAVFEVARNRPKRVGTTVCSQDNRLADVEQVAEGRVRLLVRGFAVSTNAYEEPIKRPFYLFQPSESDEPREIRIRQSPSQIWDGAEHWAECDFR